jgi:hypothetical protein
VELAEEQIAKKIGVNGSIDRQCHARRSAAKAGIRPMRRDNSGGVILGDAITAIEGKKVESPNELSL